MRTRRTIVSAVVVLATLLSGWSGSGRGRPRVAAAARADAPAPQAWLEPALSRLLRDAPASAPRDVTLEAARGEVASFQVMVRAPPGGLTHVDVSVSPLVAPDGDVIPAAASRLFLEKYVTITKTSPDVGGRNRPLGPGTYPDGLVPFASDAGPNPSATPFTVAAGQNQGVWVDVVVPRSARRGVHVGAVQVKADQGSVSLPVKLGVWGFELPARPSLRSSFGLYGATRADARYQRLLLEHRVMPFTLGPAEAAAYWDRGELNVTGLPFYSHRRGCAMDPPPAVNAIEAKVASYPARLDTYVYVVDEPWFQCDDQKRLNDQIVRWARNVHGTRAKTLVTVAPTPALMDDGTGRSAVDIWVVHTRHLNMDDPLFRQARSRGNEIWSYAALVANDDAPKWQIDFAPVNYRITAGFISQSLGLTGILYWEVNYPSTKDPWTDPTYTTSACIRPVCTLPGDGLLIYPGEPVGVDGPVPSMRLKWIRQGVDDYEYVELLKKAGRGDLALKIARSVGRDLRSWAQDPAALDRARHQLGEELDRLEAARPSP